MQPIPNTATPTAVGTIFEAIKERIGRDARLSVFGTADLVSRLNGFILNVLYWYAVFVWVSV